MAYKKDLREIGRGNLSLTHPLPIYLKVPLPNTFATSDLLTSINFQYPDALFELFYLKIDTCPVVALSPRRVAYLLLRMKLDNGYWS